MIITIISRIVIRKPLEFHVGKTRYSSLLHISIFIAPALIAAFLINVPKFFETKLVWIEREEVGACYISILKKHGDGKWDQFYWDLIRTILTTK